MSTPLAATHPHGYRRYTRRTGPTCSSCRETIPPGTDYYALRNWERVLCPGCFATHDWSPGRKPKTNESK